MALDRRRVHANIILLDFDYFCTATWYYYHSGHPAAMLAERAILLCCGRLELLSFFVH